MLFGYLVLASLAFFTLWVVGYWLNRSFENLSDKWSGAQTNQSAGATSERVKASLGETA